MIKIIVPARELYDEENNQFIKSNEHTLILEHSLISLSKWESKWEFGFLNERHEKTEEQSIDYIRCMTINNVPPDVYKNLTSKNINDVYEYINSKQSATVFNDLADEPGTINKEPITSELIYYWMVALTIPFECEKWPLQRLINLIRICNIKNKPPKKISRSEAYRRNAEINARNRAKYNSKG